MTAIKCYPDLVAADSVDASEIYRTLAGVLQRATDGEERTTAATAGLLEMVKLLIRILAAQGLLNEGHQRLLARVCENARPQRPKIRLRLYVDKYQVPNSPVDCEERIPICHGRCCSLTVEMSKQDLEERQLLWDVENPYVLKRERDGRCTHQDRATKFCGVYHNRPADCRSYDCRKDDRIWLDFEKMIPAPMSEELTPPGDRL